MDLRTVDWITYKLVEPEKLKDFIEEIAEKEWEAEDFEKYGKDLHGLEWKLEEVEISKIRVRPELLVSKNFQIDLRKRVDEQRKLHASKTPIPPIVLRGSDLLIFDGYARVHFLKEIGVTKCLAYVGKLKKPKLYILCGLPFAG